MLPRTRRAPSPQRGEGWGEGASDYRQALAPLPDLLRFARKSTSPRRGEVEQAARLIQRLELDDRGAVVAADPKRDRRGGVVNEHPADVGGARQQIIDDFAGRRIEP